MNQTIAKAIALNRNSPDIEDAELERSLFASGIDAHSAAWLVRLVPMACCRILFQNTGVKLSATFTERLSDGVLSEERLLADAPLWKEISAFVEAQVQKGILSGEDLLLLSGRSTEFDAIKQLLNTGSNLSEIATKSVIFLRTRDQAT